MPLALPLFSFGWTNPAMLAWLTAAAVPLLIHLWSRRNYREVSWAAMEYLLAATKRRTRRFLFEQWLLLAVRTALVALIVLAVAEPYWQRPGLALAVKGNTHRMLVLDGSYSMAYQPTDKTRFDRAKELARQIVGQSPQGDAFTLVVMSSPQRVVVAAPALDPAEIIREIDALRLPQTTADLPATVAAIRQVVDGAQRENPRLTHHEIYFLTDMQRITWAPKLSATAAAEFLEQSQTLADTAMLYLIDLGQPSAENLAVTRLRAADSLLTIGQDVQLDAEIKNFGRQSRRRQPVELLVDGRRVEQKEVDVAPNATATARFAYRFDTPTDHAVEVRAMGDALDVDNHRYLAAPVRQAIRVLCIEGRPSGRSFRGAADYLAVALSPQPQKTGAALVQAEVATESALLDRNLAGYDCLFLCNVAQFTASEAHALDAYLRGGGSLVFWLGDRVVSDRYNRELGGAGQGRGTAPFFGEKSPSRGKPSSENMDLTASVQRVLPATIGPLSERPQLRLDPLEFRHPILRAFRGRGEASLLTTPVFKYFKLTLPETSRVQTVLALANGDPLIVEESVRRGRVLLVATSAEPSWSALPLWPSFVPLVQEMVAYCARGQLEQRNLTVGEPLEAATAAPSAESPTIRTPDGRAHSLQRHAVGDDSSLVYADTWQNGIYRVKFGPPADHEELFALNVNTIESDLSQVDPDELRAGVWSGVPFVHQTSWRDLTPTVRGGPLSDGSRLHIDLLYAVLGFLLLETLLAWRMGR
jgi:hypothetical protein